MVKQLSESDKRILAITLLGEAAGEGATGMTAVANVIRNRAESGKYPSDPVAVATQKNGNGAYQFSAWSNPTIYDPGRFSDKEVNAALSIIDEVFSPGAKDPTGGAMYYYANKGENAIPEPGWFKNSGFTKTTQIGNHKFGSMGEALRPEKTLPKVGPLAGELPSDAMYGVGPFEGKSNLGNPQEIPEAARTPADTVGSVWSKFLLDAPNSPLWSSRYGSITTGTEDAGSVPLPRARPNDVTGEGLAIRAATTVPIDSHTGLPIAANGVGSQAFSIGAAIEAPVVTQRIERPQTVYVRPDGTERVPARAGDVALPPGVVPHLGTEDPQRLVTPSNEQVADQMNAGALAGSVGNPGAGLPYSGSGQDRSIYSQAPYNQPPAYKVITVKTKVENPEWGKVSPKAVQTLEDIHDKQDDAEIAAQGLDPNIPQFIYEDREVRIPITAGPRVRGPGLAYADTPTVLNNGMVTRPIGITIPQSGQKIQTRQFGEQTIGTRLNNSPKGYTITNDNWFNNLRPG